MQKEVMMDWRRVVLILLALGFGVGHAQGEIVYRTPIRFGTDDPIDLDSNGRPDFAFGVRTVAIGQDTLSIFFGVDDLTADPPKNGVLTLGDGVPEVSLGTAIGPNVEGFVWDDDFATLEIPGVSPAGNLTYLPPTPATQLIGIRFHAIDGLHYGWLRLARNYWAPYDLDHPDWPEDPGSVFNWVLPRIDHYNPGVIDWAYESMPNTAIVAGAVPEPATWVLLVAAVAMIAGWKLRRRLAAFFILLLVPESAANAEIIHGVGQPLTDNRYIDMNRDGTIEFWIQNLVNNQPPVGASYQLSLEVERSQRHSALLRDEYGVFLQLGAGRVIGPSFLAPVQWSEPGRGGLISARMERGNWFGPWETSPVGFLGIRLERDDGVHYGWIRLDLTGGAEPLPGGVGELVYYSKVIDWAYESTPDTPIVAGAVPEPSSATLVLALIASALALASRRRRLKICR